MADAVEVAIEAALLERAVAFAAAQAPAITISLPNVVFTPPANSPTAKYLRASFLPVPSFAIGISYNAHNQHYGLFQIDVFYGLGGGEMAPKRIAAAIVGYFKRGTRLTRDGFTVEVSDTPQIFQGIKDDPWWMIPVRVPYRCFARPTV